MTRFVLPFAFTFAFASPFTVTTGAPAFAQNAPQCELDRPVMFAGLDWDSNAVHTAIAAFIITHGYGCDTDVIPGSSIPLINGMIRGDVDVAMEIWRDNVRDLYDPAVEDGKLVDLGPNFPDANQAWYVPRYLIDGEGAPAPDLKSVADLARYKDLFADPENRDKGRFYNCVLGWGCEKVNTKKLHAYGLDEAFANFRSGSSGAFSAAVEAAFLKKDPILFYYWGPSWLLGKLGDEMVPLEEPAFDEAVWQAMQDTEDPETVTQATAYPLVAVSVSVSAPFHDAAPQLVEFLTNYETTTAMVSELLAWMQENNATPEEAANAFLSSREDVWSGWVSDGVAARVRDALSAS